MFEKKVLIVLRITKKAKTDIDMIKIPLIYYFKDDESFISFNCNPSDLGVTLKVLLSQ